MTVLTAPRLVLPLSGVTVMHGPPIGLLCFAAAVVLLAVAQRRTAAVPA